MAPPGAKWLEDPQPKNRNGLRTSSNLKIHIEIHSLEISRVSFAVLAMVAQSSNMTMQYSGV
jgi:predicted HTH domain antitoxin